MTTLKTNPAILVPACPSIETFEGRLKRGSAAALLNAASSALLAAVFFLTFAAIGMDAGYADEGEPANINPHNFKAKELCSVCHTHEPPMLKFDTMTVCVRCHQANIGNHPVTRHPIGKAVRIQIPVSLPLNEERQMVCYTCHDPHNGNKHPRMLRIEYIKLCAACHVGY
ncbi:MAG: hypothetical protein HZB21_05090 [Deltaproteobacteria bacterium]|nr:hypothetical protein [Deltaproteobacteria bacterium]